MLVCDHTIIAQRSQGVNAFEQIYKKFNFYIIIQRIPINATFTHKFNYYIFENMKNSVK